MKVLITGHVSGIGKALADCFASNGYTVVGYDKSEGNDITDPAVQAAIIDELDTCDVFINNAYSPEAQFDLLESAYNTYQGHDKTIIHIGSKLIDFDVNKLKGDLILYHQSKTKSHQFIQKNWHGYNTTPRIINIMLGHVNTEAMKSFDAPKLEVDDIAGFVYYLFKTQYTLGVHEVKMAKRG